MCKKLGIILILAVFFGPPVSGGMLKTESSSPEELLRWATDTFGGANTQQVHADDKEVLILQVNEGSGVARTTALIYSSSDEPAWRLAAILRSNSADLSVNVDVEKRSILFRSKSGKLLLTLSFDALNQDYDPADQ